MLVALRPTERASSANVVPLTPSSLISAEAAWIASSRLRPKRAVSPGFVALPPSILSSCLTSLHRIVEHRLQDLFQDLPVRIARQGFFGKKDPDGHLELGQPLGHPGLQLGLTRLRSGGQVDHSRRFLAQRAMRNR